MKVGVLLLLIAVCYVECRKIYPTINKNANLDFINNESGGVRGRPANVEPLKPSGPVPSSPISGPPSAPAPKSPVQAPAPKPVAPAPTSVPVKPTPPQKPVQPVQSPTQIKPVPVNPAPVANPITTPGPGSVKQLVNFYDSQGKASPIRPYSYSQAVKQG